MARCGGQLPIMFVMFQLTTSHPIRLYNGLLERAVIGTSGLCCYWKVSDTPGVVTQLAIHGTDNAVGVFWRQALRVVLALPAQRSRAARLGNPRDGSQQYRTSPDCWASYAAIGSFAARRCQVCGRRSSRSVYGSRMSCSMTSFR